MKVYKIRLNPEDAKYGLMSREEQTSELGVGEWQMAKWVAAVDSTRNTIFASLPEDMRRQIVAITPTLPNLRTDSHCYRCDGKGYRGDYKHWVPLDHKCYRCMGSRLDPTMHPVFVRRRAIDTIRKVLGEGDQDKVDRWANRVIEDTQNPYRCVLLDIAQDWLDCKDISKLPH